MTLWSLLFWFSLAFIFYANFGYYLLLWLISRLVKPRPVRQAEITPSVTLFIAARDEQAVIGRKIENSLALDYPPDKLQVVVVSDGSRDQTDVITRRYAGRGVVHLRVDAGLGKIHALNQALPRASGEILLISDADSHFDPQALKLLVRNFADPQVGAVTGEEVRVASGSGKGQGEGFYARLDNRIKRLEGQLGSLVMVNGGFFAIRKELYPLLPPHLIHDSIVPCRLHLQGFRTAYEPQASSLEVYPLDAPGDFKRRLRTVGQAFYSYLSEPRALNPVRSGGFALAVWSHRFSRWFVFPFLLAALLANAFLASSHPFYLACLLVQLGAYLLAGLGFLFERVGRQPKLFYFPFYFVYIHLAAFTAVVQAMAGRRIAAWKPTARQGSS